MGLFVVKTRNWNGQKETAEKLNRISDKHEVKKFEYHDNILFVH